MQSDFPVTLLQRIGFRYGRICEAVETLLIGLNRDKRVQQLLVGDSFGLRRYCKGLQVIRHLRDWKRKVSRGSAAIQRRLHIRQRDLTSISDLLCHENLPSSGGKIKYCRAGKIGRFFQRNRLLLDKNELRLVAAEASLSIPLMKKKSSY